MKYDLFSLLLAESEKLSFAFIAGFLSFHFGASEHLLYMVQWLFVVDFIVGVFDAANTHKFCFKKAWEGIKRIVSLYLALLIVGFGTSAFDVAFQGRIDIGYNGSLLFDVFIYILIVFELASINKHLAGLGFSVNKQLECFFERLTLKISERIFKKIDESVDNFSIDKKEGKK